MINLSYTDIIRYLASHLKIQNIADSRAAFILYSHKKVSEKRRTLIAVSIRIGDYITQSLLTQQLPLL